MGRWKNQNRSRVNIFDAQFRAYGEKKPLEGSRLNFCLSVDIHDVITCATFCDDRLRGLGVAMGRISRFPIDWLVALRILSHYRASV